MGDFIEQQTSPIGPDARQAPDPIAEERALREVQRRLFEIEPAPVRVGRFLILEQVGAGTMGTVYAAYDPQLDRKVAIKMVTPHDSPERLLDEARAMAKLSHPNVAAVFESGIYREHIFLIMELVEAGTLRQHLAETTMSWRETVRLFVQAASGLCAAHEAGITHGDFKPENVLIGSDGRLRVTDFGLARAPELELGGAATGGTPSYMSPEQIIGGSVDARSDQFSFFVALYEALYGSLPFDTSSAEALRESIVTGRIQRAPKGRIPGWLHASLVRGLATDPTDRFASMDDVIGTLARARSARRRVAVAALVGVVFGGGLIGATVGLRADGAEASCPTPHTQLAGVWDSGTSASVEAAFSRAGVPRYEESFSRLKRHLDQYAISWSEQFTDTCRATRVRKEQSDELHDLRMRCLLRRRTELKELVTVLRDSATPRVVRRATGGVQDLPRPTLCADIAALRSRVPLPASPQARAVIASLRKSLARGRALHAAGEWAEARTLMRRVAEQARKLDYPPLRGQVVLLLASLGGSTSALHQSLLHEAATAGAAAGDRDVVAEAWIRLMISIGYTQARYKEALALRPFVEASLAATGNDARLRALLANALGMIADEQGDHTGAQQHFRESLELRKKVFGVAHRQVAASLNNLGDSLRLQGRYTAARDVLQESLAIKRDVLGPQHPDVAASAQNLAAVLIQLGALAQARTNIDLALELHQLVDGPRTQPPQLMLTMAQIAHLEGKSADALRILRGALEQIRLTRPDHPVTAELQRGLGVVLLDRGKRKLARLALEEALRIQRSAVGDGHANRIESMLALGELELAEGKPTRARAVFDEALGAATKLSPKHALTAASLVGVADTLPSRSPKALAYYQRGVLIYERNLGTDPRRRGHARLALARALGTNKARARALLKAAVADLGMSGAPARRELAVARGLLRRAGER